MIETTGRTLKRVLQCALQAAPKSDPRAALKGVCFKHDCNTVEICATSGKLLYKYEFMDSDFAAAPVECVVSRQDVQQAINGLKVAGTVLLEVTADCVRVLYEKESDCWELLAMTDETGAYYKYPNFNAVIPKEFSAAGSLPIAQLIPAIRRARIFTEERHGAVTFQFSGDVCEIESEAYDKGAYFERIPAQADTVLDSKWFCMNHKFIFDIASKCKPCGELTIHANPHSRNLGADITTPIIFKSKDPVELWLVMPIRMDADLRRRGEYMGRDMEEPEESAA
jgi:DNA polymerase III sliding clamp (beta) subunit (PCNA family)